MKNSINFEKYHTIKNYSNLQSFFMTLSSPVDHWLFVSSSGGITAGRISPENAIFPYETVDKIHENWRYTGPKTIIFANFADKEIFWQPFNHDFPEDKNIERNLYKSFINDEIVFEEINKKLNLSFKYSWRFSKKFGFIRKSYIENLSKKNVNIKILDGIANILPANTNRTLQTESSCLLDAYKKAELLNDANLAIYHYSSIPTDRAEAIESLKATIVWSTGIKKNKILLSSSQVANFAKNSQITEEKEIRGKKGAYFITTDFLLRKNSSHYWNIVIDTNKDIRHITEIQKLSKNNKLEELLYEDIEKTRNKLIEILTFTDAFQKTGDEKASLHHTSNVLFNIMRGGYIYDARNIIVSDFLKFLKSHNINVLKRAEEIFGKYQNNIQIDKFEDIIKTTADKDLKRLSLEYLPLTFSRRHGDPSRPWNNFAINVIDERGNRILAYQGNWRDLFQNWEALAFSYPKFIFSFIAKFLNASSAEGYNPYRIMREGFEWEEPEKGNPWANIGYWGDHQIIYLLRLLEFAEKTYTEKFHKLLNEKLFSYSLIPYKIKKYSEICVNPRKTIDFDDELNQQLKDKTRIIGNDGKLLHSSDGNIIHVSMLEKILVPLLSKISNFVPDGGIWLNTQRPEWNDANNALAGYGLSMVTVCYTYRYLLFFKRILEETKENCFDISKEIYELMLSLTNILNINVKLLTEKKLNDSDRKKIMDCLGNTACNFRTKLYENGLSGSFSKVNKREIVKFIEISSKYFANTIEKNQRNDGLFHSYNILFLDNKSNKAGIKPLYEMLEGQVAVLSANYLSSKECIKLLKALKKSKMFRKDQYSYMLYPDRKLKTFIEKSFIPPHIQKKYPVVEQILKSDSNDIFVKDAFGKIHFNPNIKNEHDLDNVLKNNSELTENEKTAVKELYEEIFRHSEFTGRSGTFFAYEGLGSIYWHMVSKLLLAVQENYFNAVSTNATKSELNSLFNAYYDIRKGLGFNKTPKEYGAFPTDPYSHTPKHAGASQPGMTGQVKEEIITRFGELGVFFLNGKILFNPSLIKKEEFKNSLDDSQKKLHGKKQNKTLSFSICGTPVEYSLHSENMITVCYQNGKEEIITGKELTHNLSTSIFERKGEIKNLIVYIDKKNLWNLK